MKKTVQIEEQTARRLYPTASPEFKSMLEDSFGKDFFTQKITVRIKSYLDACAELGEEPLSESQLKSLGFTDDEIDYRKLKTITRAYNEGWEADYNNANQQKWIPWFVFSPSGVRFNDSYYDCSFAGAGRAARLCFKDKATSDAAGETFTELYAKFINQ